MKDVFNQIEADLETIDGHLDAINAKLNRMPTTRELWMFVAGFAAGGAFTLAVLFTIAWAAS